MPRTASRAGRSRRLSYILLVGWETVLVSLATLATATVFARLGWGGGDATKIIAFLVVAGVVVFSGIFGFNVIMRLQTFLTVALTVLTVGYVLLTAGHINWGAVNSLPSGSAQAVLGALIFAATGFGLGWVNSGADYSRYLPRSASSAGVVGWTTFGAAIAPVLLVVYGLLLAASDQKLSQAIAADPVGALTTLLPTWYLLFFALVAIGGLIGGAVLDIYSSGLALLTIGLRVPRWTAAAIDGVIMILGTIYVVWIASNFIGPFQGFLITLGVPIAAWCGVFLADLLLRKRDYAEADLYDPHGPLRANQLGRGRYHAGGNLPRLGSRDQHLRRVAQLAGLPAGPARPRSQRQRPVDVRQPRRARGAGGRLPRPVPAGPRARRQAGICLDGKAL